MVVHSQDISLISAYWLLQLPHICLATEVPFALLDNIPVFKAVQRKSLFRDVVLGDFIVRSDPAWARSCLQLLDMLRCFYSRTYNHFGSARQNHAWILEAKAGLVRWVKEVALAQSSMSRCSSIAASCHSTRIGLMALIHIL